MLSSREILRDDVKPHFSSLFLPLVLLSIDFSCLNDYSDACQMVIFLIPSSHLHLLAGFRICKGDFFSPFLLIPSFLPSFIYISVSSDFFFIQWASLCSCHFKTQHFPYLGIPSSGLWVLFDMSLQLLSTFKISGPAGCSRFIFFFSVLSLVIHNFPSELWFLFL